ncbi:hypothetical protein BMF94_5388 [Rhodotorula taiwanensis]|uniref:Uncharacterized protein n=1 Tax=Rhodotorula taiwanensis TaxID=741276 RepID=A0A2S5B494_9BASI|nr:hypothetical protein BMF94_5388 [Rhodotorula taiwanensis]
MDDPSWRTILAWDITEPSERGRFPVWHDDILPVLEDTLARFWSNSAAHNAVKSHLEHEQTVFHPWYSGLAQERDGLDPAKPGDTARRNETKKLVRLYLACIRKRLETVVAIINSRGIDAAKDFVLYCTPRVICYRLQLCRPSFPFPPAIVGTPTNSLAVHPQLHQITNRAAYIYGHESPEVWRRAIRT